MFFFPKLENLISSSCLDYRNDCVCDWQNNFFKFKNLFSSGPISEARIGLTINLFVGWRDQKRARLVDEINFQINILGFLKLSEGEN